MSLITPSKLVRAVIVCCVGLLVSCGNPERSTAPARITGSGAFNGSWKVTLKTRSDGCNFGLQGRSFPATVVVVQRGNKVSLTISGFAKSFKGSVSGSNLSASGTYLVSGLTLSGTIGAQITRTKTLKISSAKLKVRSRTTTCNILLSGSGKR